MIIDRYRPHYFLFIDRYRLPTCLVMRNATAGCIISTAYARSRMDGLVPLTLYTRKHTLYVRNTVPTLRGKYDTFQ